MQVRPAKLAALIGLIHNVNARLKRSLDHPAVFIAGLVAICAIYAFIEWHYVARLPLAVDEMHGFAHAYRLRLEIPYRDFAPYKTVLGYYVQLLPALFTSSPWLRFLYIKWFLAAVTALALFVAAWLLRRHYHRTAILCALAMLVMMNTFLERSAELRVDMLTSLFGLFSLIYLLRGRWVVTGLLAGAAFITSQKGIYFVTAGGLAASMMLLAPVRKRDALRDLIVYSASAGCVLGGYILVFAAFSSLDTVLGTMFHPKVKALATAEMYDLMWIRVFWVQTVQRNPFFYLMAAMALGRVFSARSDAQHNFRNLKLFAFALTMSLLCLWHRQPWPYFFVLLLPTLFVLIADLLSSEHDIRGRLSWTVMTCIVLFGLVFPLLRMPIVLAQDNSYQRYNVELAWKILQRNDGYLAGVGMLYPHPHIPSSLSWIDHPKGLEVKAMPRKAQKDLLKQLDANPPKIVLWNNRLRRLFPALRRYIDRHYHHYHGSIHVYKFHVKKDATAFNVPFDGRYQVDTESPYIYIQDQLTPRIATVYLTKGRYRIASGGETVTLRFVPNLSEKHLQPQFQAKQELFPDPYKY